MRLNIETISWKIEKVRGSDSKQCTSGERGCQIRLAKPWALYTLFDIPGMLVH